MSNVHDNLSIWLSLESKPAAATNSMITLAQFVDYPQIAYLGIHSARKEAQAKSLPHGNPNCTTMVCNMKAERSCYGVTPHRGWNVIDTASNYRGGRGERAIGYALTALHDQLGLTREMLFISTKAGFLQDEVKNQVKHCCHS